MIYDIDPNFDIGEFTSSSVRESIKCYCDVLSFLLTTLIIEFSYNGTPIMSGFVINKRIYCSPDFEDYSIELDKLFYLMYPDEFIEFQQYNYESYNKFAPHSIVPEIVAIKKLERL